MRKAIVLLFSVIGLQAGAADTPVLPRLDKNLLCVGSDSIHETFKTLHNWGTNGFSVVVWRPEMRKVENVLVYDNTRDIFDENYRLKDEYVHIQKYVQKGEYTGKGTLMVYHADDGSNQILGKWQHDKPLDVSLLEAALPPLRFDQSQGQLSFETNEKPFGYHDEKTTIRVEFAADMKSAVIYHDFRSGASYSVGHMGMTCFARNRITERKDHVKNGYIVERDIRQIEE